MLLVATEVRRALERASCRGSRLGGEGDLISAAGGECGVMLSPVGTRFGEVAGVGAVE